MHDRNEHVARILFFVAGGLAGAGATLLLAPRSGRDTRGRLGRRLRRAARRARVQGAATEGANESAGVRPHDDGHRPPAVAG
jgi:gas vesicle protein